MIETFTNTTYTYTHAQWMTWDTPPHLEVQTVQCDASCNGGHGVGDIILVADVDVSNFDLCVYTSANEDIKSTRPRDDNHKQDSAHNTTVGASTPNKEALSASVLAALTCMYLTADGLTAISWRTNTGAVCLYKIPYQLITVPKHIVPIIVRTISGHYAEMSSQIELCYY